MVGDVRRVVAGEFHVVAHLVSVEAMRPIIAATAIDVVSNDPGAGLFAHEVDAGTVADLPHHALDAVAHDGGYPGERNRGLGHAAHPRGGARARYAAHGAAAPPARAWAAGAP